MKASLSQQKMFETASYGSYPKGFSKEKVAIIQSSENLKSENFKNLIE